MEWLRRMKLKKALFSIAFLNITVALILSLLAIWGCAKLRSQFATEGIGVIVDEQSEQIVIRQMHKGSVGEETMAEILSMVQILLPIVIYICALFLSASMFYRLKLREPIEALAKGADRIIANDLDFEMKAGSEDELGQLCTAFETVRKTLLANNRELWRQAEERRRLNAAFAHDLRNPVTVLKGSVKLVKSAVKNDAKDEKLQREQEQPSDTERHAEQKEQEKQREQLTKHLQRIEDYTNRIERYVETMSSIQTLEDITVERERISWSSVALELEHMIRLVGADSQKAIDFQALEETGDPEAADDSEAAQDILVDRSILFQIAENLVSNAIRFAERNISVQCVFEDQRLSLVVSDDGCGFPDSLLKKGIRPFQKGGEDAEHFGMGLYICALLCEKHGGTLTIQNKPPTQDEETVQNSQTMQNGATVCAVIKIQ